MMTRCYQPGTENYERYGGRGIAVCERWRNSVTNFVADMGERPPGMTIDRIDNDKDYSPSNCKWSTASQQARNRRRLLLTHNGRTMGVLSWAEEVGIKRAVIYKRLKLRWTVADAITKPVGR